MDLSPCGVDDRVETFLVSNAPTTNVGKKKSPSKINAKATSIEQIVNSVEQECRDSGL
jgi:hypothetical protein